MMNEEEEKNEIEVPTISHSMEPPQQPQQTIATRSGLSSYRGVNCCSLPHGSFSFLPSLFATTALILSLFAHFSCRFIKRSLVLVTEGTGGNEVVNSALSLGLWLFQDPDTQGVCFYYPSNFYFDDWFIASRAFAPLAAIIGGLVMITFWFTSCVGIEKMWWRFCGFLLILVTIFEGLTFLIFKSYVCDVFDRYGYECSLDTGGRCGVAAIVFWFTAAIMVFLPPEPRGEPQGYPSPQVIQTETIQPDGTRIIETRQVLAG